MAGLMEFLRNALLGSPSGSAVAVAASGNSITTSQELEQVFLRGSTESLAGVYVTPMTSLLISSVSAAVSLISECVSMLPLHIYRRNADGTKSRVTDHPVAELFERKPNRIQSAGEFLEWETARMMLWGYSASIIDRRRIGSRAGQIREIMPVHPDRVNCQLNVSGTEIEFTIALADGSRLLARQRDVLHVRDKCYDGCRGVSRVTLGRDSIGLARAAEKWGAQLFGNGAMPSGILTTDEVLSPETINKIRDSWKKAHGGENALGTAVLDAGMKWLPTAMNMRDSQFIEARKFQVAEIARIWRIPPHMLGDLERATFSNIEQQSIEFVKYTLGPWLRRWQDAVNTQLLADETDLYAEFVQEALLKGDIETRYKAYAIALQNEFMAADEVRQRENLNPRRDGRGGEFRNPAINPQKRSGGGGGADDDDPEGDEE